MQTHDLTEVSLASYALEHTQCHVMYMQLSTIAISTAYTGLQNDAGT